MTEPKDTVDIQLGRTTHKGLSADAAFDLCAAWHLEQSILFKERKHPECLRIIAGIGKLNEESKP